MNKMLDLPEVIDTPKHFFYGPVDIHFGTTEKAKVEKLADGMVKITKSFIVKDYTYQDSMNPFEGFGSTSSEK